jgi:IclR family pca regulon transcriptional regulator
MGRVLLAALPDDELESYLGRVRLEQLAKRTLSTPAALRTELRKVRSQGYAVVDQELEEGLRAIAAPIRDRTGTVVGAVNVSVQATRASVESMRRELLPRLLAATARIDADLAVSSPHQRPRRSG